jgi:hypothetical protein
VRVQWMAGSLSSLGPQHEGSHSLRLTPSILAVNLERLAHIQILIPNQPNLLLTDEKITPVESVGINVP